MSYKQKIEISVWSIKEVENIKPMAVGAVAELTLMWEKGKVICLLLPRMNLT